jgi:two-component system sensor histidine kinase BaeS
MVARSLLGKLLGINVLTIAFVIIIVWLAVDYLAAGYFQALMNKYNVSPISSHQMFVHSVHRYLIWVSLAALMLAGTLSFLLMKRVLGPLRQMTGITQKISSGDYSGEIPVTSRDEVGQLAVSFNRMAELYQATGAGEHRGERGPELFHAPRRGKEQTRRLPPRPGL